jgi:hypothetical protein
MGSVWFPGSGAAVHRSDSPDPDLLEVVRISRLETVNTDVRIDKLRAYWKFVAIRLEILRNDGQLHS